MYLCTEYSQAQDRQTMSASGRITGLMPQDAYEPDRQTDIGSDGGSQCQSASVNSDALWASRCSTTGSPAGCSNQPRNNHAILPGMSELIFQRRCHPVRQAVAGDVVIAGRIRWPVSMK